MLIVFILLTFLTLPKLILHIFEDTYLWQIKEYRFDRLWNHMKYEGEKAFRGSKYIILKAILLFLALLFFIIPVNLFLLTPATVFFLEIINFFLSIKKLSSGKFARPKMKSIRNIMILTFVSICFFVSFLWGFFYIAQFPQDLTYEYSLNFFVQESKSSGFNTPVTKMIPYPLLMLFFTTIFVLISDLFEPFLVSIGVGLTFPLSFLKRARTIKKAKEKLNSFKNLKIVGITGSFGKTSTKEILFDILSNKYKVVMTPGNFNTTVGIAETILNEVDEKTEIFLAEMGAYVRGEVKKSVELAQPNISIITNVGKSHLDLFGNVENIVETKSEIYWGLKPKGIAILNADNERLFALRDRIKKKTVLFSNSDENPNELDSKNLVSIANIEWVENSVKFDLRYGQEKVRINTNVVGRHQLKNLLSAIAIALQLKFEVKELKEILKDKEFQSSHFSTFIGPEKTLVIDDAYNTNPDGFSAALAYLSNYTKQKQIVVTRGIPEIGSELRLVYTDIADKIVRSSDLLITTDKVLCKEVYDANAKFLCIFVEETEKLNEEITKHFGENTVILLEGRVAPETMKILKNDKGQICAE